MFGLYQYSQEGLWISLFIAYQLYINWILVNLVYVYRIQPIVVVHAC
ncbi:hypothetical protein HJG54_31845 [Leptolyngbya sp. NK1-12]|uniref:Uncharacterized protein n=1 Tax=Leptolyngbya sp. NK1-12 TaxID=2547451 RepID=A0AA96WLI3_9CYAN|nr:hypothetical protein [Leptolyngbya sp. NK1-12]WNZ27474.1 hypothetical protein HJG54_31845 [Leptolyngbya sp. NK1-12]